MAKLWSLLRGTGSEERLSLSDYANMLNDNPLPYPVGMMGRGGKTGEAIDNDFLGYVRGAYKADGIVFACMTARSLIFSEARFQFQGFKDGRPQKLFGGPGLSILERPWPNGTTGELLSRAIQDVDLSGNFYCLREPDRLRRLRPDWVQIVLTKPPNEAVASDVAGYLYMPGGSGSDKSNWEIYPIDGSKGAVAHWSPIPDPEAHYRGMSWLTPVVREIIADKAATQHKLKFFENAATPNLAVSFKETVTHDQFQEFMAVMDANKHGVEHAYETLYLGGGANVSVVGANLHQMDFRATQGMGESRIAAAARIHPSLVGLSEALQGSSLNRGNFQAAKDIFSDGTLRPLWRSLCAAFEILCPPPHSGVRLWYDDRDIAFLRTDRETQATISENEASTIGALIMAGYEPDSVVAAMSAQDWALLKHTGLFSVQLQPPNSMGGLNANQAIPKGKPGATPDPAKPAAAGVGKPGPVKTSAPPGTAKPSTRPRPKAPTGGGN